MTGVPISEHQVRDSSFEVNPDDDHLEEAIPMYPGFLTRIHTEKPKAKLYTATPWDGLSKKFFRIAQKRIVANDEQVKDSTIKELKEGDADLMLVNFNEVNKAGLQYGFSADQQGYKDAVLKVDGYIGELMETLKSRPEYENE